MPGEINEKRTAEPDDSAQRALSSFQDELMTGQRSDILLAFGDPSTEPLSAGTRALDSNNAALTRDSNNRIATIDHKKFNFKMNLGRDAEGNLTEVKTFAKTSGGSEQLQQTYRKEADGWFNYAPNGQKIRMQGDLRVNEDTGQFTQVLRRALDGGGNEETTRTTDLDGTEALNRMDGSKSIFKHDSSGKMTDWIEKDSAGTEKSFSPFVDSKGLQAWKSSDGEVRYNPKVEDNGNVTYQQNEDLGKNISRVITSSGDHIVNGGNGVKYDFNFRGDVTSIQFPQPRLFEGQWVKGIAIGYRDPVNNQGKIIDSLTLYNAKNQPFMSLGRVKDNDPSIARNEWNSFDGRGRQIGQVSRDRRHFYPSNYVGDFAVKDGLISTTEPFPRNKDGSINQAALEKLLNANPNYKTAVDEYKRNNPGKPMPTKIMCTYENSAHTSKTTKPNNEEYKVKVLEGDPRDLDIPVPGEASSMVPVVPPPPPLPEIPLPSNPATPTTPTQKSRPSRRQTLPPVGGTRLT